MFINISNHPLEKWKGKQLEEAQKYGKLHEIPFPYIEPEWDSEKLSLLAIEYVEKVRVLLPVPNVRSAIHLVGEPVFVFKLTRLLLAEGYSVVASTTHRRVEVNGDEKTVFFDFIRFRSYE